jgi:hypothetical protein
MPANLGPLGAPLIVRRPEKAKPRLRSGVLLARFAAVGRGGLVQAKAISAPITHRGFPLEATCTFRADDGAARAGLRGLGLHVLEMQPPVAEPLPASQLVNEAPIAAASPRPSARKVVMTETKAVGWHLIEPCWHVVGVPPAPRPRPRPTSPTGAVPRTSSAPTRAARWRKRSCVSAWGGLNGLRTCGRSAERRGNDRRDATRLRVRLNTAQSPERHSPTLSGRGPPRKKGYTLNVRARAPARRPRAQAIPESLPTT